MFGQFTVGWYDKDINDWYFNGEFEQYTDAMNCARKTAIIKNCQCRVTNQITHETTYINPPNKKDEQ